MRIYKVFLIGILLVSGIIISCAQNSNINAEQLPGLATGLRFEENKGQVADTDGNVRHDILFSLKDKGMTVFFKKDGISYQWHYTEELIEGPYKISEATGLPLSNENDSDLPEKRKEPKPTILHTYTAGMNWINANPDVEIISEQPFSDYNNFYLAHCPDGVLRVKSFARVTYKNLYPGIDVVYYIKNGHLKYDVHVREGADLQQVKFAYNGVTPIIENGKIKVNTPLGFLEEQAPIAWDATGEKVEIKYSGKNGKFGFTGSKNSKAVTVDPELIWGTYYGGTGDEEYSYSTLDAIGNIYLSGTTNSSSSIASDGFQNTYGNASDAYVVKIDAAGTRLWGTYYGGGGSEWGYSVATDGSNLVLAGKTTSTSSIATSGAHQETYGGGQDAFLVKFNSSGSRIWATYYGGSDFDTGSSVTIDTDDNVYISGYTDSASGIATSGLDNTYGGGGDLFLVKFNSSGIRQWGTYYGDSFTQMDPSVTYDGSGNVIVSLTNGGPGSIIKYNTSGAFQWIQNFSSTTIHEIVADASDNIYATGSTSLSSGFATIGGGLQGSNDGFVLKLNSAGTKQWATYYGGPAAEIGYGIALDASNNIYIGGQTTSTLNIDFNGHQASFGGGTYDAFLAKFNLAGSLQWSTYYGGNVDDFGQSVSVDGLGNVYLVGYTNSLANISTTGSHQSINNGGYDAYVVKFKGQFSEPTSQPSGIGFSNISSSSLTVGYAAATGTPSGYIALRKASSSPTSTPVDGTEYSIGAILGDGSVVVQNGIELTFIDNSLLSNTMYYYKIFSYNGSGDNKDYLLASPLAGNQTTLVTEPASQPSGLIFSNITSSSFKVDYTAASGSPTGYIAIRKIGSAPTTDPTDGTTYSIGNTIGDGTVAYVGSLLTFNESSLAATTNYYYKIYSYNGSGGSINYRITSPLTNNQITFATEPPSQPTGLIFSNITSSSFKVDYTAASGSPSGYIAIRKIGSASTTDPTDGTNYSVGNTIGDGTVAYVGNLLTFNESSLAASTNYYYKVYSYNGSGSLINYRSASPLTNNQTTLAAEPTAQPTGLIFSNSTSSSFKVDYTAASGSPSGYIAIRKIGSAPTTDPTDGTNYSAGNTIGDGTVAYVGNLLTFNESSLAASTNYYYKVYSYNGSGSSINYRITSPLTNNQLTFATEPSSQPTGLIFSNITSSSFKVDYTAASGSPTGYIAIRKTGSASTTDPTDGIIYSIGNTIGDGTVAYVGNLLTFNEVTLTSSTTYFYKIFSFNGSGSSINYYNINPLTNNQTTLFADITGPQFSSNTTPTTIAASGSIPVSINVTDAESGVTSVKISYGPANSASYTATDIAMTNTSGNTWQHTIPASAQSELGVRYSINTSNGVGLASTVGPLTVAVNHSNNGLAVPYTTFGTSLSNYRIVSVPLSLSNKTVNGVFGDDLGNYGDLSKWRMFKWQGSSYQELSGSSQLEPGNGYWLIAKESTTLDSGPGNTVGSVDNPVEVSLTQGWNLIGNPYPFNLSWSDIKNNASNAGLSLSQLRVSRTGTSFENATVLNDYEGGFIFMNSSGTLTFPAEKNASVNGRISSQDQIQSPINIDDRIWELPIQLQSGDLVNALNGIGMNPLAGELFDNFDDFTLPRFMEYLELNHSKKLHETHFSKDVVPSADSHQWSFAVESSNNSVTTMSWPTQDILSGDKKLVLVDTRQNIFIDMKHQNSYSFSAPSSFKIVYGNENYVKEFTATLGLKLSDPYPNPFTEVLEINLVIPESAAQNFSLQLIDNMGKIIDVTDEHLSVGSHYIKWYPEENGIKLSPGIYILRLQGSNQSVTRKVVFVH